MSILCEKEANVEIHLKKNDNIGDFRNRRFNFKEHIIMCKTIKCATIINDVSILRKYDITHTM